jgi:trans-2,3-dihydro-3-hydroxyanthranilate isomerase
VRRRFFTADVFTDRIFGGNPLAVFPDGCGIDPAHMQLAARELNLSETVFVLPPEAGGTRRLRIFTPASEVPFAGHPTLGTAFVLAATGELALTGDALEVVFEEGVGPVRVRIEGSRGRPLRTQLSPAMLPETRAAEVDPAAVAAALSLTPEDLVTGAGAPRAASCGLPFLFVELVSRAALARARLSAAAWERSLARCWAPNLYLFTRDGADAQADLRARMFAPAHGVAEDPATGSAVAALAGVLSPRHPLRDGTLRLRIEQGVEIGRPSLLELELEKRSGEVCAVRVAGRSVLVSEGEMELPGA